MNIKVKMVVVRFITSSLCCTLWSVVPGVYIISHHSLQVDFKECSVSYEIYQLSTSVPGATLQ